MGWEGTPPSTVVDSLETMIALKCKVNWTIIMQDPSTTLIETFGCLAAFKWCQIGEGNMTMMASFQHHDYSKVGVYIRVFVASFPLSFSSALEIHSSGAHWPRERENYPLLRCRVGKYFKFLSPPPPSRNNDAISKQTSLQSDFGAGGAVFSGNDSSEAVEVVAGLAASPMFWCSRSGRTTGVEEQMKRRQKEGGGR